MCGRYILGDSSWAEYHEALSILKSTPSLETSYNIKPTQSVQMAFMGETGLRADIARWWYVPGWHKGDVKDWKVTTFNARIETAHEKNTFRGSWKSKRCIIPATGYFEWTGKKGQKQPWYISIEQNVPVFFFAGLYSVLNDGSMTNTILTREADKSINELHHRMPVILSGKQLMPWMTGQIGTQEAIETLGLGFNYNFHRIQPFGIKDDGPELIERSTLI